MPHKRPKSSVRASQANKHDLVPTNTFPDMPRRFAAAMKAQELREQRKKRQVDTEQGVDKKAEKKNDYKAQLKIQPGEKFRDFNRRVDDQMRETFLHIAREGRSTSLKRKRQREKQKLKLQEKREKMLAETRVRDWDDLKDEVRFGEVAEAPPTLTAIPKARKKAKMDLPSPQITSNDPSDASTTSDAGTTSAAKSPTDKRQWRSRNLSEAAKQALKQERERVVAEYRAAKAKRLAAAGLTPLVTTRLTPLVAGVTPSV